MGEYDPRYTPSWGDRWFNKTPYEHVNDIIWRNSLVLESLWNQELKLEKQLSEEDWMMVKNDLHGRSWANYLISVGDIKLGFATELRRHRSENGSGWFRN